MSSWNTDCKQHQSFSRKNVAGYMDKFKSMLRLWAERLVLVQVLVCKNGVSLGRLMPVLLALVLLWRLQLVLVWVDILSEVQWVAFWKDSWKQHDPFNVVYMISWEVTVHLEKNHNFSSNKNKPIIINHIINKLVYYIIII